MDETRIKIPLSNGKIVLLTFGSIILVLSSVWLVWLQINIYYSIVGIIGILFFGACGIGWSIKLFDGKMGLIIDSEGIWDNSSGLSSGFIRWKDIEKFGYQKIQATEILMIYVKNPDEYIENAENRIKALALKSSDKMFGTPFSIGTVGLKINFRKFETILKRQFAIHKDREKRKKRRKKK